MAKKPKVKGPESVGFKEIFGVTAIATNDGFAAIFMSTMFMVFMTDYAGLGSWVQPLLLFCCWLPVSSMRSTILSRDSLWTGQR